MEIQSRIELFVYVDGVNDIPFYGVDYVDLIGANGDVFTTSDGEIFNVWSLNEQITIGEFKYSASRMGGAPSISFNLYYKECLDKFWGSMKVYGIFNNEKFFLKQVPTSSLSSDNFNYIHNVELVSERIVLDNVYFFDVTTDNILPDDKPVSNSSSFSFYGDIHQFAKRLNASLEYTGLAKDGWKVIDNPTINTDELLVSFSDKVFSQAAQELFNTYKVPYYFKGKELIIGYSDNVIETIFKQEEEEQLLSITKTNSNYKWVNKVTAIGSSDNIPFYYPNNSPKGVIAAEGSNGKDAIIINSELYANKVKVGGEIEYNNGGVGELLGVQYSLDGIAYSGYSYDDIDISIRNMKPVNIWVKATLNVYKKGKVLIGGNVYIDNMSQTFRDFITYANITSEESNKELKIDDGKISCGILEKGGYQIIIGFSFGYRGRNEYKARFSFVTNSEDYWYDNEEEKEINLSDVGLRYDGSLSDGLKITQRVIKYIKPTKNLMPPIYRNTDGKERFYKAINGIKDENGNGIIFKNPYTDNNPREHIINADDIKPSIKEMVYSLRRIDMFEEFAYDADDNNDIYEGDNGTKYEHPYFFAKLRPLGFNLFDCAIEGNEMVFSMTSGSCAGCNFKIGVSEEGKNTVQVDSDGNLLRDENGRVICGVEELQDAVESIQKEQNDTTYNSVWIALMKEEDTYGIIMPQAESKGTIEYHPKGCSTPYSDDGDTFVILNINLPYSYIEYAENKLEKEIIKYMKENNEEKFTFKVNFSRVFFAENLDILKLLNENARIWIEYDSKKYLLYISSFSYNMSGSDVLPDIQVELAEELSTSTNAIQKAISGVKDEIGRVFSAIDFSAVVSRDFIRKNQDDETSGIVNFTKGIKFGEGGIVEILNNNSAKLTIDYLEVTKKATFSTIDIQEKTHIGGQLLLTVAAINCGEVEPVSVEYLQEREDGSFETILKSAYRCYFQTKNSIGQQIFNNFAVNDLAICQTYNEWGSRYYWRLVVGIGEDYIDLSDEDCDESSTIPQAGDKIIQFGNILDETRQSAIILAAYGEDSPYIIQYKGINSFDLPQKEDDERIVTKLSRKENIVTGKLKVLKGSTGFSNFDDADIGAQNILRNSGFTGDYLSEPLSDKCVIDAAKKLFSDPLDHWRYEVIVESPEDNTNTEILESQNESESENSGEIDSSNTTTEIIESKGVEVVSLPSVSESGFGVKFNDGEIVDGVLVGEGGMLIQKLHYPLLVGEYYTLSFNAKGIIVSTEVNEETEEVTNHYNVITCTIGDVVETLDLTDEWKRYAIKIQVGASSDVFKLEGASLSISEPQLERGTVATKWKRCPLDNDSNRIYYESLKYLQQAINEGSTEINGGLVLTNHIKVGNYANFQMIKETGGMQGTWIDDNSPFLWGGGTNLKALYTIERYKDNPTYQPSEDELINSMCNFVITHGGKAILNDAIVRGTIYADSGTFRGKIEAQSGYFGGLRIGVFSTPDGISDLSPSVFNEERYEKDSYIYSNVLKIYEGNLVMSGTHCDSSMCYFGNSLRINVSSDEERISINDAVLNIDARKKASLRCSNGDVIIEYADIIHTSGQFKGFHSSISHIRRTVELNGMELNNVFIVDVTSEDCVVVFDTPKDGQTFEFYKYGTIGKFYIQSNSNNIIDSSLEKSKKKLITSYYTKIVYSESSDEWYIINS